MDVFKKVVMDEKVNTAKPKTYSGQATPSKCVMPWSCPGNSMAHLPCVA